MTILHTVVAVVAHEAAEYTGQSLRTLGGTVPRHGVDNGFAEMTNSFDSIRKATCEMALRARAEKRSGSTTSLLSLSTYAEDDKEVWREFRRDLIMKGFRSKNLDRHKDLLKAYMLKLDQSGVLDQFQESSDQNVEPLWGKKHVSPETTNLLFGLQSIKEEELGATSHPHQTITPLSTPPENPELNSSRVQSEFAARMSDSVRTSNRDIQESNNLPTLALQSPTETPNRDIQDLNNLPVHRFEIGGTADETLSKFRDHYEKLEIAEQDRLHWGSDARVAKRGFGTDNFVAASITLRMVAWAVYQSCKDLPRSGIVEDISSSVLCLHALLRWAEEILLDQYLSESTQNNLSTILDNSRDTLRDLNSLLERCDPHIKNSREILRGIALLRSRLVSITTSLSTCTIDGEVHVSRDEDYFDEASQSLYQHVQQWVIQFSKFSDVRACRFTKEIKNDKIVDQLESAVFDGSDVDDYLSDRVKRRDIFMSVTMTMIWELVFDRYIFGIELEKRKNLKTFENILATVLPPTAVCQWRSMTLTVLSKCDSFGLQREHDTEAVVQMIFQTLSEILPPPTYLEDHIQKQLKQVVKVAVNLSVEMYTQRAEYMLLALQPVYYANGNIARQIQFNSNLMNECSRYTVCNEELETQQAAVGILLFPIVVKMVDDSGAGDDATVIYPAQVLVANPERHSRLFSHDNIGQNPKS